MARKKMTCNQSIVKEVKDVMDFLSVADKMSEERIADSIDNLAQSAWKKVWDKAFSIVNDFAESEMFKTLSAK